MSETAPGGIAGGSALGNSGEVVGTTGTVYSKLDANSGFHQLVFDPESRKFTTFITPFGRFIFKRLPYVIASCHVDDSLVIGHNQAEHDERLRAVLDRLQQEGITLNLDKCLFSVTELDYLGQIIDGQGICKDPSKVQAIVNFPGPHDVMELRRFLGMVNQLMKFCPDLAELVTKPLRDLLRKNKAWLLLALYYTDGFCGLFKGVRHSSIEFQSDDVTKLIFLKLWVLFNCSEQPI